VETFARRTGSGSGHHGENTKHRTLLDSLLAPKMVRNAQFILIIIFYLKYPMLREHAPCKYFCMETTFDG
jgi:hypothetical protein